MTPAVFFDLDDTLYPETEFVMSGYRAVVEAFKKSRNVDIFPDLKQRFDQGERGDLFTPVIRRYWPDVVEADVKPYIEVYRRHKPTIHPFPETVRVLEELKKIVRLGLISDGILAVQTNKLDALGLRSFFDVVLFSDEFGREFWKPHTRPFETALSRIGALASESIYVADNPIKDFFGARQAGLRTIRVKRKGTLHEDLVPEDGFEADVEISTLTEVPHQVSQMLKRALAS